MRSCAVCRVLKTQQIVCVRFILIVYLTMKASANAAAGTESETDERPNSVVTSAAPTGHFSRTTISWLRCIVSEALGVNLSAEFHAEIQTANMPGPLCLHERSRGPAMRGLQPVCPANNGPEPEPIQSPWSCESHCWSTFSQTLTRTCSLKQKLPGLLQWPSYYCLLSPAALEMTATQSYRGD